MNTFTIINRAIAFFAIIFCAYFTVNAQTLVYSNDFSANNNSTYITTGAIGSSGYSVTRSGADWGGRIFNGYLDLTNDVGGTGNANGFVLASIANTSFLSPFTNTLSSNPGLVSWNFNMRQSRPDPAGFGSGAYGVAFIIAGTSNTSATAGTGYALVLGQSGSTDPVRLVRYSGGLQGTLTNMITSNTTGLTDFGANYLSIRVNYTPTTNTWELFLRNDGTTAFAMPNSGTMTSQGTVTNNTYTSTSLPLMGGYWQGSTGAGETAFFDQITIYVSSACTNVSLTSVTATDNLLCPTETTNITANGVAGTAAALTWYTGPGGTGTNLGSTNPLTNRGPGIYYARITGDCGGPIEQSITINAASLPNTSNISGSATPACSASGVSYSVTNTVGSSYVWTVPSGATIASGQGTSNVTVNFGSTNGTIAVIETNAAGCTGSAVTLSITLAGCGLDANFSANPSPEANSTAITGQDVWYYFVAPAPGLSVHCASAVNDILLELQDDAGNTLDIENLVSGVGAERLNYVGLIPGNAYFIAVRNYNSAIGVGGVFTICAQLLQASSCDAPGPIMNINRCAGIKADFTYANQYIFHLDASTTLTGSYNSNVGGLGLTTVVLLNEFEVTYGDFYPAVLVDALYLIPNGAGTVESLIVPGTTPMAVSLSSQPDLYVRASDACPNNKSLASLIRAEPFICGPVIDYQWEFTQVLPMPGLPVTAFRGLNDRLFRINLIPGVQPGATYSVRVRPIFAGNIPGNWSATPSCIKVLGAATFTESSDIMIDQPNERSFGTETNSLNATVFPNPNAGDAVFVSLTGIQDKAISIRILDALGKSVFENTFPVEETEHTLEIALDRTVPAGLYFLEVVSSNERKSVSKLLIQR